MCVLRHRKHHHHFWLLPTFIFLLFSSTSARTILAPQPSSGTELKHEEMENGSPTSPWNRDAAEEKKLGGPGSTPPSCRSKCGWCNPCHPVHVPVQPGLIIRLEYYPEAWRCKCGNKLFLP